MRLSIPQFEGQQRFVPVKTRREIRWVIAGSALLVVILVTVWAWYSFVGSRPRVVFSVRLPQNNNVTLAKLVGPDDAVMVGSGQLARFDVANKRKVWSVPLRETDLRLRWHIDGHQIWSISPSALTRYNWENGAAEREINIPETLEEFHATPQSLFVRSEDPFGVQTILRVSLPAGDLTTESIAPPPAPLPKLLPRTLRRTGVVRPPTSAALPENAPDSEEFDGFFSAAGTNFVEAGANVVQVSVRLLEKKLASHKTVRERSGPSALSSASVANSAEIANEILNEMQEDRGGGVRIEDVSRYEVTLRRLMGGAQASGADWTGEVSGPPHLWSLPTVDVLVAGKLLRVFDKQNKPLWESKLNYGLGAGSLVPSGLWDDTEQPAPCAEHRNTLYLFDEGILTAFELASGNARWRLPSVGVSQLQFDDRGFIYATTTDADTDQIKYADQIDITRQTAAVIMKVDPKQGKILWRVRKRGNICWLTDKFFYGLEASHGEGDPLRVGAGVPAHMRIYRLDPENGRVLWEYYQKRAPLAVDFSHNTIQLVFNGQMQVLRFLAF